MNPQLGALEFGNPVQVISPTIGDIIVSVVNALFVFRVRDKRMCYQIMQPPTEFALTDVQSDSHAIDIHTILLVVLFRILPKSETS